MIDNFFKIEASERTPSTYVALETSYQSKKEPKQKKNQEEFPDFWSAWHWANDQESDFGVTIAPSAEKLAKEQGVQGL